MSKRKYSDDGDETAGVVGEIEQKLEISSRNERLRVQYDIQQKIGVKRPCLESPPYICHIASHSENTGKVAIALSDNTVEIHASENLSLISTIRAHADKISEIRFTHSNANVLWTSSYDGTVKCWDLRTKLIQPTQELRGTCESHPSKGMKTFLSFDINKSEDIVCAGTELLIEDAYLIFWDLRSVKLLGGYWDSHSNDITQVAFHPSEKDSLASGSTDGLINVFDLRQSCEDDALVTTVNTESFVDQFQWFSHDNTYNLASLMHTDGLQIWDPDEVKRIAYIRREEIGKDSKNRPSVDYLVQFLPMASKERLHLLTGSSRGAAHIWQYNDDVFHLVSTLTGAHHDVIRCGVWDERNERLLTGGEDGILCSWKQTGRFQ